MRNINAIQNRKKIAILPAVVFLLVLAAYSIFVVGENQQNVALAFPHAVTVVAPPADQVNAKPIVVVLGHANEPTFGVLPGVHDGKHGVEVFLEDAATVLPLSGHSS